MAATKFGKGCVSRVVKRATFILIDWNTLHVIAGPEEFT